MATQLQCWNEQRTQVRIQFKNKCMLTVYPRRLSSVYIKEQEEIAYYSFENRMKALKASESGYLMWSQPGPFIIQPSQCFQVCAVIEKERREREERNSKMVSLRFGELGFRMEHEFYLGRWGCKVGQFVQESDVVGEYNDGEKLVVPSSGVVAFLARSGEVHGKVRECGANI